MVHADKYAAISQVSELLFEQGERGQLALRDVLETLNQSDLVGLLCESLAQIHALHKQYGQHGIDQELFSRPFEDVLSVTARTANCLKAEGIRWLGDVVRQNQVALLKTPNLGKKSLRELTDELERHGLQLGMKLVGWKRPTEGSH